MSPFVSPLSAIAQAHDPTLIGSVALRRFCPHRSDRCRVLMPTCRNSPLWQRMSAVIMFCLRFGRHSSIIEQRGHHVMCVNWNEPQVSRLQLCEQPSAWTTLEYELVDANWGIKKVRVEPATRSAVATWMLISIKSLRVFFVLSYIACPHYPTYRLYRLNDLPMYGIATPCIR